MEYKTISEANELPGAFVCTGIIRSGFIVERIRARLDYRVYTVVAARTVRGGCGSGGFNERTREYAAHNAVGFVRDRHVHGAPVEVQAAAVELFLTLSLSLSRFLGRAWCVVIRGPGLYANAYLFGPEAAFRGA